MTPSITEAEQLYRHGELEGAIRALNQALRDDPAEVRARTFLFELLCFAGEYDRARKQLDAIGSMQLESGTGTAWYGEALRATEQRDEMFRSGGLPDGAQASSTVGGVLNGMEFEDLRDADPRIGYRLEALVAGRYTWIPFAHLSSVTAEPPGRLRDLFWIPAEIEAGPDMGRHTNQVLVPAMTPDACHHPDERVRLGRVNGWRELASGEEIPVGQKLLIVDGEEFPLLEVRDLKFAWPED